MEFVALFTDKRTDVYLLESLRSLPPLGSAAHLGLATGFLLALAINARLDVYKVRNITDNFCTNIKTRVVSTNGEIFFKFCASANKARHKHA